MEFMRREGVNPMKAMLGVVAQAPIFMLFYFTLREMAEKGFDGLSTGGTLWFTNLTIPDPYYILPVLTASAFILTIEVCSTMPHGFLSCFLSPFFD
jgi:YidC/Oxa1 family membrane protein insertase